MKSKKRFLIKRIIDDTAGRALFEFSKRNKKKFTIKNPKKIIIFKLSAIGDSILTLPAIKQLKEKTKAKIILVCSGDNKIVFENHAFIDELVLLDVSKNNPFILLKQLFKLKKMNADIAVDLSQTGKLSAVWTRFVGKFCMGFFNEEAPEKKDFYDLEYKIDQQKHMILNYFNLFNFFKIPLNLSLIKIKYSKRDVNKISKLIFNKKNLVGLHPVHEIKEKTWDKKKFARIIDLLIKEKKTPVIIGSKKEMQEVIKLLSFVKNKKEVINFTGKLNLSESFALMEKLDFFIANDGGMMHAAAAMGLPTLGIFNIENPLRYSPFNKKSYSVHKDKITLEEVEEILKNYFL